ncbi:MAG: hypothetical protein EA424_15020, partial [Planctomycetaceae bacterium]
MQVRLPFLQRRLRRASTATGVRCRGVSASVAFPDRLALARCHRSLLPFAWANGDQPAADTAKQQAIAVLEQLASQNPHDLTIQFERAENRDSCVQSGKSRITYQTLTVAVMVGFISLCGIAVRNGLLL